MKTNLTLRMMTIIASILLLSETPMYAQQNVFTRVYSDLQGDAQGYAAVQAPDNGFYIAGQKDLKPLAFKVDANGDILWAKKMSDQNGSFFAVTRSGDSAVVFAGYTADPGGMISNIYCVKMNSAGDTLWTRAFNTGSQHGSALSAAELANGSILVSGYSNDDIPPFVDAFVLRIFPSGDLEWGKLVSINDSATCAFSAREDANLGILLTGVCNSATGWGDEKMFMAKLNPNGDPAWAYVTTFDPGYSSGLDLIPSADGVTWLVNGGSGGTGVGLMRTDTSGNPIWSRMYGYGGYQGFFATYAPKLSQTTGGGYMFVDGNYFGPGWAVTADDAGMPVSLEYVFMNTIGAMETSDGGFAFLGNGPIMGVEMGWNDRPQIGLIKSDQQFYSNGCLDQGFPLFDTLFATVSSRPMTVTDAGWVVPFHPAISDAGLLADSGCVAVTGAVHALEMAGKTLTVWPNPSAGVVNLAISPESPDDGVTRLEIFNARGELVAVIQDPGNQTDLANFPSGLYLIRAETKSGPLTKRLILQK